MESVLKIVKYSTFLSQPHTNLPKKQRSSHYPLTVGDPPDGLDVGDLPMYGRQCERRDSDTPQNLENLCAVKLLGQILLLSIQNKLMT